MLEIYVEFSLAQRLNGSTKGKVVWRKGKLRAMSRPASLSALQFPSLGCQWLKWGCSLICLPCPDAVVCTSRFAGNIKSQSGSNHDNRTRRALPKQKKFQHCIFTLKPSLWMVVFKFHVYRLMQPFEEQYSNLPPSWMMLLTSSWPSWCDIIFIYFPCTIRIKSRSLVVFLLLEVISSYPISLMDAVYQSFLPFSHVLSSAQEVLPHFPT